ncbi:MAG: cryptochrome/photolyase family protein [Polyangia bacterium]
MPTAFSARIAPARPGPDDVRSRRWIYVPYDQLTAEVGPLAGADPATTGLVLVESREKARRRPYHKKKLAVLLSNMRHFALEQAARGFKVLYLAGDGSFAEQLAAAVQREGLRELVVMRPAERELRVDLEAAVGSGRLPLSVVDNALHLTAPADLRAAAPDGPPYRMDAFYRQVRRRLGVLMAGGKPVGGRFSFDGENRKAWPGEPAPPPRFSVPPDEITSEVLALVERTFPHAWGTLAGFDLPASAADAAALWQHVTARCLPWFGPFEDALSVEAPDLFHSKVSAVVNLGRLVPRRLVADTEALYQEGALPLPSAEGFIRQLLGWREFVRHVHEATDGFRTLEPGAAPSALAAAEPLPAVFWGGAPSGLRCLDHVIERVHGEGYSHHITRLMVLSNLATLLGVSPRALCDWFWIAYVDAYDWVVEPNVLAMGTYGAGGLMTTKPYVSGAAYLHKMGDACDGCRFDPGGGATACPITPMYWAFLDRNRERLAPNERMKLPLASAARRTPAQRQGDHAVTERVRAALAAGREIPADVVERATRGPSLFDSG